MTPGFKMLHFLVFWLLFVGKVFSANFMNYQNYGPVSNGRQPITHVAVPVYFQQPQISTIQLPLPVPRFPSVEPSAPNLFPFVEASLTSNKFSSRVLSLQVFNLAHVIPGLLHAGIRWSFFQENGFVHDVPTANELYPLDDLQNIAMEAKMTYFAGSNTFIRLGCLTRTHHLNMEVHGKVFPVRSIHFHVYRGFMVGILNLPADRPMTDGRFWCSEYKKHRRKFSYQEHVHHPTMRSNYASDEYIRTAVSDINPSYSPVRQQLRNVHGGYQILSPDRSAIVSSNPSYIYISLESNNYYSNADKLSTSGPRNSPLRELKNAAPNAGNPISPDIIPAMSSRPSQITSESKSVSSAHPEYVENDVIGLRNSPSWNQMLHLDFSKVARVINRAVTDRKVGRLNNEYRDRMQTIPYSDRRWLNVKIAKLAGGIENPALTGVGHGFFDKDQFKFVTTERFDYAFWGMYSADRKSEQTNAPRAQHAPRALRVYKSETVWENVLAVFVNIRGKSIVAARTESDFWEFTKKMKETYRLLSEGWYAHLPPAYIITGYYGKYVEFGKTDREDFGFLLSKHNGRGLEYVGLCLTLNTRNVGVHFACRQKTPPRLKKRKRFFGCNLRDIFGF
eukprot:545034_1